MVHMWRGVRGNHKSLILVVCLLLTLAISMTPARAATITVTKLTDDNTAGTLRISERNAEDGKTYTVQYFERARFEFHPENAATMYAVLLG